jgi:hypothetical protein
MITLLAMGRFDVGFVLIAASNAKAHDPSSLARTVRALGVPRRAVRGFAWTVILWEALASVYLLTDRRSLVADIGVLMLLGGLMAASIWAIASRRDVACSCFGSRSRTIGLATLGFSSTLLAIVVVSLFFGGVTLGGTRLFATWALALVALAVMRWMSVARSLFAVWMQRRHLRGLFTQSLEV